MNYFFTYLHSTEVKIVICVSRPLTLALATGRNVYLPMPALNLCLPVLRFTVNFVIVTVCTYTNSASTYLHILTS